MKPGAHLGARFVLLDQFGLRPKGRTIVRPYCSGLRLRSTSLRGELADARRPVGERRAVTRTVTSATAGAKQVVA